VFRIKICGITRPEDGRLAAEAGADAIGLNFYARSKRYVSPKAAREIAAELPAEVARVGVFVNATAAEILDIADTVPLDWVQLHGDEPPGFLPQLAGRRIIRALRCGSEGLTPLAEYLEYCESLEAPPAAVLVDALTTDGEYGGTGQQAPWDLLAGSRTWLLGKPLILAGGLVPENVAQAIAHVWPLAVDTASGVESSPGVKDAVRMRKFVAAARRAFEQA